MILASFLLAVVVIASLLGYRAYRRHLRRVRFSLLELRPNCLLTRYPILFLASKPTLLQPFEQWDDIPLFLREHGYDVVVVENFESTWTSDGIRSTLEKFDQKFHLIASETCRNAIEELAMAPLSACQTMTVVATRPAKLEDRSVQPSKWRAEDLKPRKSLIETFDVSPVRLKRLILLNPSSWKLEERFLELAISLAERDAQWSD
jgi:hypothetical protein